MSAATSVHLPDYCLRAVFIPRRVSVPGITSRAFQNSYSCFKITQRYVILGITCLSKRSPSNALLCRMNRCLTILAVVVFTLALFIPSAFARQAGGALHGQVEFTLEADAHVSVIVLDHDGRIVRELLHGEPCKKGENTVEWNGRDNGGRRLPAGEYTWKLLATDGMHAKYVMTLGTSPNTAWEAWPGNNAGIYALCCDGQSLYFGSCGQSTIQIVKQSLTGKRAWTVPSSYQPWQGPIALGRSTDKLFSLQPNGMVYRIDADTSDMLGRFNASWAALAPPSPPGAKRAASPAPPRPTLSSGAQAMDLAANDEYVAISYYGNDGIRWYKPGTGRLIDEARIPKPLGIAFDKPGRLLVISGGAVMAMSRADKKPKTVISDVPDAYRLAVDPATGDIFVAMQGATQQVARYRADGTLVRTFGRLGGRRMGTYKPEDFSNVTDITADPSGGFDIAESDAPRRVARFNPDGSVRREWNGPQCYAPYAQIDPADSSTAWGDSAPDSLIRYRVNVAAHSWSVAAVYSYGGIASGLFSAPAVGPKGWQAIHRGSETYLARANPFRLVRVNASTGALDPVAALFTVDFSTGDKPLAEALKRLKAGRACFLWCDANGDGKIDGDELTAMSDSAWIAGQNQIVMPDFGVRAIDATGLHILNVDQWLPTGAPRYASAPTLALGHGSIIHIAPETPAIDGDGSIWSVYNADDGSGNRLRGVVKWDREGAPVFKVGVSGIHSNSDRYLSHIVGLAHGCVAVADAANTTIDVWDEFGLWVGQFFEAPDFAAAPHPAYRVNPFFAGNSLWTDTQSGDVYLIGSGVNNNPVIAISGWNDWVRNEGTVTLR